MKPRFRSFHMEGRPECWIINEKDEMVAAVYDTAAIRASADENAAAILNESRALYPRMKMQPAAQTKRLDKLFNRIIARADRSVNGRIPAKYRVESGMLREFCELMFQSMTAPERGRVLDEMNKRLKRSKRK